MSGLFGKKSQPTAAQTPTAASGLNIQSSVFGKAVPIIYGTTRIAGNLLLYGNFVATPVFSSPQSAGGGGGKGGIFGGGGGTQSGVQQTGFTYTAAIAFALCEGPIHGIGTVWKDKDMFALGSLFDSLFTGTYPQSPWGTTVSWTVTDQNNITTSGTSTPIGYNGLAYVAATTYQLGDSAQMPNITYEVQGICYGANSSPDADPWLVINDVLTNVAYGLRFPSALINPTTTYQNYCYATGFFISPSYTDQRSVSDIISEIMIATNSEAVWSSGLLNFIPYGDQTITANGHTYTAPGAPLFDLTDDDFIRSPQAVAGDTIGPISMSRKRPSDKINSVKLEYLDRSNSYNPAVCYANDQALIDSYGLRTNGSKELHLFCNATAANLSANLQLRREHISNVYKFDLDMRYILLDPMDIVTVTAAKLGLNRQWVRITEITENDDGTLSFIAEEYLAGSGAAPAYAFAQGVSYSQNRNTAPGAINNPVFIEPPFSLANALEVWVAASAPTSANWGGADIYLSTDGVNFKNVGRVTGSSRAGVLTSTLNSVTQSLVGQTIDVTNTLAINLTQSNGALDNATNDQATSLASLCYVDGEFLSYGSAVLTSPYNYNLTYLVRGAYESTISSHAIGSNFVRLDTGIFKFGIASDRVGTTVYIKFLSFNPYGGGQLTLASAPTYTYTVLGTALSFPLDDITNLAFGYIGNIASIDWSEIEDFRPVLYEIRKGDSWETGQFILRQAHPPFKTFGGGTYWISGYSQPLPGLVVYSENPQSVVVNTSSVTANITATRTENPTWSGTITGDIAKVGTVLQTTGITGGTYTIPTGDRIFITYSFACAVLIDWFSTATPLNDSVFAYEATGAQLTSGSTVITGLKLFSGNAILNGGTTVTGVTNSSNMGPGQPVDGVGIVAGTEILSVPSSGKIILTVAATTGSTVAPSTAAITVYPALVVGMYVESTSTSSVLPGGAKIVSLSSFSAINLTTTALVSSTAKQLNISIDFINDIDLFGANAAINADTFPEIRISTDAGGTWSPWQRYVQGYYLGNGFDARISMQSVDINSIGILESFTFSVDVPDRWDHYNSFVISSLGSTITFRPDGGTTAAFNGGPQGSSVSQPSLVGAILGSTVAGQQITFSAISLSGCVTQIFTSSGVAQPGTANIIAKGY